MTAKIPKIGEIQTAREVQAVLRHGGGNHQENAIVALGLIEDRVRKAYDVDGPLPIESSVIADHALGLIATLDRVWAEHTKILVSGI